MYFFEHGEWGNEYEKSNGIVVYLVMLLGFSARGWMGAYGGIYKLRVEEFNF